MSLQAHLSELASKHQTLEAQLADAVSHPAATDQEIAELKRKKLRVKDEMLKIEASLVSKH
jgi:hypothetical protein